MARKNPTNYQIVPLRTNANSLMSFDVSKPVSIVFYRLPDEVWIMGTSQSIGKNENGLYQFAAGMFMPIVKPLEYHGKYISIGVKTKKKFIQCFRSVFNVTPSFDDDILNENQSGKWTNFAVGTRYVKVFN